MSDVVEPRGASRDPIGIVLSQHFGEPGFDGSASTVGVKATGLLGLPVDWTPLFAVVPPDVSVGPGARADPGWLGELVRTHGIEAQFQLLLGSDRLLVRSSGTDETIDSRGQHQSYECQSSVDDIESTLARFWDENLVDGAPMAAILQPKVTAVRTGHISNERRVSHRHDSWLVETVVDGQVETERLSPLASPTYGGGPLHCRSRDELRHALRRLATEKFGRVGRRHYEWVWDGSRLWVVQCDFDVTPMGERPGSRWTRRDSLVVERLETFATDVDAAGPFQKLECVRAFRATEMATAQLFVLEDPAVLQALIHGDVPQEVQSDVRLLVQSPIVVRSDISLALADHERVLLPRTETCTTEQSVTSFLVSTAQGFAAQGVANDEFCLLAHRFIPATAGSYSYGRPGVSRVRTDAAWGVPDGLLYYPHDSFETDAEGRANPWKHIRCKTDFIDFEADGRWVERQTGTPWDWTPSLDDRALALIADQTARLAAHVGSPVEVMHFVGVAPETGLPAVIPWFMQRAEVEVVSTGYGPRLARPSFLIRSPTDIDQARARIAKTLTRPVNVSVRPRVDYLRDPSFVQSIVEFAKEFQCSVDLEGSVLSHFYYMLRKGGVRVRAIDQSEPPPVVGRQDFSKLVRDDVPQVIERRGERAVVRRMNGDALLRLLKAKVVEEAFELYRASTFDDILEEAADVFEVLRSVLLAHDEDVDLLEKRAEEKRSERGGFERGYFLQATYIKPVLEEVTDGQLFEVESIAGASGPEGPRWWWRSGSLGDSDLELTVSVIPSETDTDAVIEDRVGDVSLAIRLLRRGDRLIVQSAPVRVHRSESQLRLF